MGRPLKIQKQGYAGTPGTGVDVGYPQINTLTDPVTSNITSKVYVIEGFGPFSTVTSMTQLQAILESPAGKDPVVLATIVDSITPANPLPPSMTIVPLPPVIYNPTTPSNASPN